MENQIKTIIDVLDEILVKMTMDGSVDCSQAEHGMVFTIQTKDAGILIGEGGKHLIALNHLVKKIAETKFRNDGLEPPLFILDVNGYQTNRIDELKNIARMSAQRVRFFKKELELEPMSAYDRRIVHSILGEYTDIKTESCGDGLERRVVIKPIF